MRQKQKLVRVWPLTFLFVLVIASACRSHDTAASIKGTLTNPVFKSWVVPIPSEARIVALQGLSRKVDRNQNMYVELRVGLVLDDGDILETEPNSQLTVEFSDGSQTTINTADYPREGSTSEVYLTLRKKE